MQAKFIVKNFGPIEHAELDLRNVNVFIGPQSSGKSTLAKLYTICKSPLSFLEKDDLEWKKYLERSETGKSFEALKFEDALRDLNIHNFISSKSIIEFDSELHSFKYARGKILFNRKFEIKFRQLESSIEALELERSHEIILEFSRKLSFFRMQAAFSLLDFRNPNNKFNIKEYLDFGGSFSLESDVFSKEELHLLLVVLQRTEIDLLSSATNYIPAERIIVPILSGALFGLMNNNVPIPKHILTFASEYEKHFENLDELDLGFIKKGTQFKKVNGQARLFYSAKKSVALSESATGFQSLIPLILTIVGRSSWHANGSYVIEEPEINLFPKAQYSLVKYLEQERKDGNLDNTYIHTYTTHSPYILSAFNNMLYAFKISVREGVTAGDFDKIASVLKDENWLNPESFNAYSIQNGTAIQILDRETGLIGDNVIDEISDEMSDDFDRLMDI